MMAYLVIPGKIASSLLSRPGTYGYRAGKFGATVCVDKMDIRIINKINRTIDQAIQEKWGENPPAFVRRPLKDGDTVYVPDMNFAGHYYLEVYGKYQPSVIDCHGDNIRVFDEKLNGRMCPCFFALVIKAYDVNGNAGVTCYPKGVMIEEDGAWVDNTYYEELWKSFEGKFTS